MYQVVRTIQIDVLSDGTDTCIVDIARQPSFILSTGYPSSAVVTPINFLVPGAGLPTLSNVGVPAGGAVVVSASLTGTVLTVVFTTPITIGASLVLNIVLLF